MNRIYSISRLCTIFTLLLVNISPFALIAQTGDGGYAESWISRNFGARPIAMAGVYTAIVNEPSGIFYNPAGTAFLPNTPSINTSIGILGLSRTNAVMCYAQEILPSLGIGVGVNNLYSGSFLGRTINGTPTRHLNNNQLSALVSASYKIEYFSLGASAKYINNSLNGANISASGVAFDVGAKLHILDLFSFGAAINNFGGSMNWNTVSEASESIPYTIRTGVAAEFGLNDETLVSRTTITGEEETIVIPPTKYVLVGMDAVYHQFDSSPSFIIGAEFVPEEIIAVRGGITLYGDKNGKAQILPLNNWGAGISLRPKFDTDFNFQFDYSISNEYLNPDNIAHYIALVFEL